MGLSGKSALIRVMPSEYKVSFWLHMYCIVPGKCPWVLKHQKVRVGGCMEEVLEWFNYSCASGHPGCELAARGYRRKMYHARKRTDL